MGLLLFVPAGTIDYWQAWLYLAIFVGVSLLISIYLLRNDPALLERRMKGGPTAETRITQKIVMLFASLGFMSLLVVSALNYRLAGSPVPLVLELTGDALVIVGFYFIFLVYRENTFASATIGVAENQKVITDRAVRAGTSPHVCKRDVVCRRNATRAWLVLGTSRHSPDGSGNYLAIAGREKFLALNLRGYTEYQKRVRVSSAARCLVIRNLGQWFHDSPSTPSSSILRTMLACRLHRR